MTISRRTLAIYSCSAVVLAALGVTPPPALGEDSGQSRVVIEAGDQKKVHRPTLEAIRSQAARDGVPLEKAVRAYIKSTAATMVAKKGSQPDGPVDIPDVMIDDLPAVEIEDLIRTATGSGMGLADAIDQVAWQGKFEKVAGALERNFPDDFAGAVKKDASAWFAFKGDIPDEAVKLARSLPVPVEFLGGRGYSQRDLLDVSNTSHAAAVKNPSVSHATSSYDVRTGTVTVEVQANGSAPIKNLVPGRPGRSEIQVKTVYVKRGMEPQDQYIRGGGYLTGCTSGFNLKYIFGTTRRHGTAGHCSTRATSTYSNHGAQGGSTTVSRVWTHQGSWGDLGYFTTGAKSPTRTFYYTSGRARYADARSGMPYVGTTVCHFGKSSGASCGRVARRDVSSGSLRHMVVMDRNISASGDSGGPWYYGGTAYGIHFGLIGGRSTFTPAYLFQNRGYDVWQR